MTAAGVAGHYRSGENELRIAASGRDEIRIDFSGVYLTVSGAANIGDAAGEARLDGDRAVLVPDGTEGCAITLRFRADGSIRVTQAGADFECGFGSNVHADGIYRRTTGRPAGEGTSGGATR